MDTSTLTKAQLMKEYNLSEYKGIKFDFSKEDQKKYKHISRIGHLIAVPSRAERLDLYSAVAFHIGAVRQSNRERDGIYNHAATVHIEDKILARQEAEYQYF